MKVATESGSGEETLFQERYASLEWGQRSVSLAEFVGQTVNLILEVAAPRDGSVGLWANPIVSGAPLSELPNVIFYIIDGARQPIT